MATCGCGSLIVNRVLALDHVIVTVHELDAAARRYHEEHGLGSVPGGRHAGHGTGNRIVPLGTSYIELMAVVDGDEAASSPHTWRANSTTASCMPKQIPK